VLRSLLAGAIIGFADAVPMDPGRLRRPLGVVWLDDRDLPDPLAGVPLMILDPVAVGSPCRDGRRRTGRSLRLTLTRPFRLVRHLHQHLTTH
jgi:hypothetical protein